MAVNATVVRETFKGVTATLDQRADNATRTFDVQLINQADGPLEACVGDDGTTQIPVRGADHPDQDHLLVIEVNARVNEDDPRWYAVTVDYSSNTSFAGLNFQGSIVPEFIANPTLRPYEIEIGERIIEEPQRWDYSDPQKAVVNSADEEFDPPAMRERVITEFVVTRNELVFNPNLPTIWHNVVNADDWTVQASPLVQIPAGVARVRSITARPAMEGGIAFWRVRYVWWLKRDTDFEGNVIGWNPVMILDQGYKTKAAAAAPQNATDASGTPYTAPVLLDGNGNVLTEGDPVYLPFNLYPEANYTGSAIDIV